MQEADLGHLAALARAGQGGHGPDLDACILLRTAGDEFQHFGRIDRGGSVGARDHGGHTARRRRAARGAKTFLVPFAWFADFDADIDDAGRKACPIAVDAAGTGPGAGFRDAPTLDPEPAERLGACLRVDQAGVSEQRVGHGSPSGARVAVFSAARRSRSSAQTLRASWMRKKPVLTVVLPASLLRGLRDPGWRGGAV